MSSKNRIQVLRHRAYKQQDGRCYYCGVRMWLTSPSELASITRSPIAWARLQCTAEHLLAQSDGGTNSASNVVAACARCNHTRHRLPRPPEPTAYRRLVSRQVEHRCWHQQWVFDLGLAP